jgi:predicted outer membrane repeat protein
MAKHATLTPESKKLVAAFAASGLVGTGLAVPMAQVAFGDVACALSFTTENDTAKFAAIQAALDGCGTTPITIDGTGTGNTVLLTGASEFVIRGSQDPTPRGVSISSSTGFTIDRNSGTGNSLLSVEAGSPSFYAIASLTVEGLAFVDGDSRDGADDANGGAIQVEGTTTTTDLYISNSTFTGNYAAGSGGAVYSPGNVFVESSTFDANYANGGIGGGAIAALGDIFSINSTYVRNETTGTGGSAISVDTAMEGGRAGLVHNTFLENSKWGGEEVASAYSIEHFGNLFAQGDGNLEADLLFGDWAITNTGGSFVSGTAEVLGLETILAQNAAPAGSAQTLALQAGSLAINEVAIGDIVEHDDLTTRMNEEFGPNTMPVMVDQRGFQRVGIADAGAFEFGASPDGDGQTENNTYYSPSTAPLTTAQEVARKVVPGFAANSTKLSKPMKKEIRKFLRANPTLTNVVCRGFTSSPATTLDKMLARERGKETCAFIKQLRPEAKVTVRSGSHTDKPGLKIRRVQITLR